MILSASRRTDIPAFYSDWFFHRLDAGWADVPHPRTGIVKRVDLRAAEAVVFWTKNPAPMLPRLGELATRNLPYYFTVTYTAYPSRIEARLPSIDTRLQTLKDLVAVAGPHSLVWRYDPVIFAPGLTVKTHREHFTELCRRMEGLTDTCVISFLDFFAKLTAPLRDLGAREPSPEETRELTASLLAIGRRHGIAVTACTEDRSLLDPAMEEARCIDEERLSRVSGRMFYTRRESGQRPGCLCAISVELGRYDTCPHGCVYCYANRPGNDVEQIARTHDPSAGMLPGPPPANHGPHGRTGDKPIYPVGEGPDEPGVMGG